MADYKMIKQISHTMGMYRLARWVQRHLLRRNELHALWKEIRFYSGLIAPGSLCFDVGANYGWKSEVFLRLGASVVAFEPQLDCLSELKARLGPHSKLTTVNTALGGERGHLTLYVGRHRTMSSFDPDWQGEIEGTVEVPVMTLDEAINLYGRPDYCKVDVEGHETQVLSGLSQPVPLVSFEYHFTPEGTQRVRTCLERLSTLGEIFLNITPAEKPEFALSSWLGKDEFLDFFATQVPAMSGYYYGDIFVRTKEQGESV